MSNSFRPTEAQTREKLIDPALQKAGWGVNDLNLVRIEIPVDGFDPAAWLQPDRRPKSQRASFETEQNFRRTV